MSKRRCSGRTWAPDDRVTITPLGSAALAARRRPAGRHPLMLVPANPVRQLVEVERDRLVLLGVVEELDAEISHLWSRLVAAGLEAE